MTTDGNSPLIALTVAYDGAGFHGFARQPGLATVQGRLESALATIFRTPVAIVGAGRTDTGVHALGQVVSFAPPEPVEVAGLAQLARSLDALAGEGIVVREARLVRAGFSARFSAISREYRYRIVDGPVAPLFLERFAWHVPGTLDAAAMRTAAEHLIGEHDFKSFCVAQSAEGKPTVRRLDAIEIVREEHLGEQCLMLRVVGSGFLHSMVRVIVGTIAEVGAGRRSPDTVAAALAACERSAAGATAPAKGLTLWRVGYPDDVWL